MSGFVVSHHVPYILTHTLGFIPQLGLVLDPDALVGRCDRPLAKQVWDPAHPAIRPVAAGQAGDVSLNFELSDKYHPLEEQFSPDLKAGEVNVERGDARNYRSGQLPPVQTSYMPHRPKPFQERFGEAVQNPVGCVPPDHKRLRLFDLFRQSREIILGLANIVFHALLTRPAGADLLGAEFDELILQTARL